jgi:hypothetical protein
MLSKESYSMRKKTNITLPDNNPGPGQYNSLTFIAKQSILSTK